jgi:hypothetical protein
MKNSPILLTIVSLLGCFTTSVQADNYSEMLAFSDGSTATLNFSFDLGTGYYTNINGTVTGSPDNSANGKVTEELGTYTQSANYMPELPASQNVSESPGFSLALFNSNNSTDWLNTPAIFENFIIQNNQLTVNIADYGVAAATLYYPDQGTATTNLNNIASYSLIDTTANPGIGTTASLSSSVPLPSSLLLFASAIMGFVVVSTKKPKYQTTS